MMCGGHGPRLRRLPRSRWHAKSEAIWTSFRTTGIAPDVAHGHAAASRPTTGHDPSVNDAPIAVLGAGIMGCCAALALAERGCRVILYERREAPMLEASLHCEGKLHLGFVYASDPSLRTARRMQQGSAAFLPVLARWIPRAALERLLSEPFLYAVHRDSQVPAEAVEAHFARVAETWSGPKSWAAHRPLRRGAREALFDPARIVAAFETGEPAIDTHGVAGLLRDAVSAEPRITLRCGFTVEATEADGRGGRHVRGTEGGTARREGRFAAVLNCLWANRAAVDAASGLAPPGEFLTRYKLGLRTRRVPHAPAPPSVTFVLGPFGDIVTWPDGRLFLSWYPAGMIGTTRDLRQSDWQRMRAALDAPGIARAMLDGVAGLCPSVRAAVDLGARDLVLDGGAIYALGRTDIDDRASRLHERSDVGLVASREAHHSIDTGKYSLAPWLALTIAGRVVAPGGPARRIVA